MRISTKARYGTRVMLELALSYGQGPVRVRDIAKRQGLSAKYIEQLVAGLKGAGLVTAVRGVHGGYSLARPPGRIRLLEVFERLEGSLSQLECHNCPGSCSREKACVARDVWAEVRRAVSGVLGAITLEDLAARAKLQARAASAMYYI
ncbi:MAG: Rrf2 family transcriptional regulator [Candidatus Coatesbacteria bacterium]